MIARVRSWRDTKIRNLGMMIWIARTEVLVTTTYLESEPEFVF